MSEHVVESELTFRAMASDVTLRMVTADPGAEQALQRAKAVFDRVESACTRFDPSSPLMRANADPGRWHEAPWECVAAVEVASRAHHETHGLFDPRVFDTLVGLGYDRTLPFAGGEVRVGEQHRGQPTASREAPAPPRSWLPRWEHDGDVHRMHLDGARIDLGGIGKGLAVRWAAEELRDLGGTAMVEAGGDCQLIGSGPAGTGWRVGMEDPRGGGDPLVVFEISDEGCATSSVRIRHWKVDGRDVHHLIDPRTGRSGGDGLVAVTVIHPDAAWAEVWSKTLFLSGPDRIESVAADRGLAVAWVDSTGAVRLNPAAADRAIWVAAGV